MTHEEVEKAGTAAIYLQGGLSEKEREEFEEHLFGCPECSGIVQADLILKTRAEVGQTEEAVEEDDEEENGGPALGSMLLDWAAVHPRLSAAAMMVAAFVLPLGGYQNFYVLPELHREKEQLSRPRAIPFRHLKGQTRSAKDVLNLPEGCQDVILEFEVAAANDYSGFRVLIEELALSVSIPYEAVDDFTSRLLIPCSQLPPGGYTLRLYGLEGDAQILTDTFRFETQLE